MKKIFSIILFISIVCSGCGPSQRNQSESSVMEDSQLSENMQEEKLESLELEKESEVLSTSSLPEPSGSAPESSNMLIESRSSVQSKQVKSSATSEQAPSNIATTQSSSSATAKQSSSSLTDEKPSTDTELDRVATEIITLINAERTAQGLNKLKYNASLTKAANIRSKELYQNNYFAHTRPNGSGWETVLKVEVPLTYKSAGENLENVEHNMTDYSPEYDASYWYSTWEGSPSHYENMVRPEFTHVGVGIYRQIKNGLTIAYATTLFANIA